MNNRIKIDIDPLSVNSAFQGRRFKTPKYNDWITEGLWILKGMEKQKKPYKIRIQFYMSKLMDIDNPIKALLDLLVKAEIIEDDRYIEELYVKKIVSKEKKIVLKFDN